MPRSDLLMVLPLVLLAVVVGSFLGALILRLPAGASIVVGRSECPRCHARLTARDLIPLLSWIRLRGRCRLCHQPISTFYPIIELAAVGVALWAATVTAGWILWASCFLGWSLLALAVIDWQHHLLPNELTLTLIPTGLGVAYFVEPTTAIDHAIGTMVGLIGLTAVAWIYQRIRRRDGLGGGDVKLLAGLGAWAGWIGLPTIILLSSVMALTGVMMRMLLGERFAATDRLPFGTYLAAAGWLVWLYGPLVPT